MLSLNVIVTSLAIVPASIMVRQYIATRIVDFAIFSLFFWFASISMFSSYLASTTNRLLFFQLHNITWVLTFYLLFLHSMRIRFEHIPYLLNTLLVMTTTLLIGMMLLWQPETQKVSDFVLFAEMSHTHSSYFPLGASFRLNGINYLSTGHALLLYLYSICSLLFFSYVYLRFQPMYASERVSRIKHLWLASMGISLVFYIGGLPWVPRWEYLSAFLIAGLFLIAFIVIRYPEGLILFKNQMNRTKHLYQRIDENREKYHGLGLEQVANYIALAQKHIEENA